MRRGKQRYTTKNMHVLQSHDVKQFIPLYMEKYNIPERYIQSIAYEQYAQYFQFDALSHFRSVFLDPTFQERQILIVGDYDVDGIMASKIALFICEMCGVEVVDVYIPNRFTDGYGLNKTIVDQAIADGFDTILTVDNGIGAIEAVAYAQENQIDVILTDHHHIKDAVPDAYMLLHPDHGHVNEGKNICGAAVVFALAYTLFETESKVLLPYVMLATLADSMELHLLNRAFVIQGIAQFDSLDDPFLQGLVKMLDVDVRSAESFAWKLIPVLNAIGRMTDVNLFAESLFLKSEWVSEDITRCIELNELRKKETEHVVETVKKMTFDAPVIIAKGENWHQGVLGIAASRIVELFQKPVILLTRSGDVYKGSGRSPEFFHLFDFLKAEEKNLVAFGGHAQACGLSMTESQYDMLIKASHRLEKEAPKEVELHFSLEALTIKEIEMLYKEIQKLSPFGNGLIQPQFYMRAKNHGLRHIGAQRQHVKLTLPNHVQLLFFNEQDQMHLTEQALIHAIGPLSTNHWQDTVTYQSIVSDWWIEGVEFFYPNQVTQKERKEMVIIDTIPQSATEFQHLKQEVRQVGACVLEWQEAQKQLVYVSDEQFRLVYKYFLKIAPILVNEALYLRFQKQGFEKKGVNLVIKVFLELEFVIIKDGVLEIQTHVGKKALTDSKTYQVMHYQHHFVKHVIYATNDEREELFEQLEE